MLCQDCITFSDINSTEEDDTPLGELRQLLQTSTRLVTDCMTAEKCTVMDNDIPVTDSLEDGWETCLLEDWVKQQTTVYV